MFCSVLADPRPRFQLASGVNGHLTRKIASARTFTRSAHPVSVAPRLCYRASDLRSYYAATTPALRYT